MKKKNINYLNGYSETLNIQVSTMLSENKLGLYLKDKYPTCHQISSEKQLYQYAIELKNLHLRKSAPLSKVRYDDKIDVIHNALGLHTQVSRIQGNKLKAKREIRVASVFKKAPLEFLQMILVHELAHIKERDHNKAFYHLCCYMQPDYHQVELDLRLYLTYLHQCGKLYD